MRLSVTSTVDMSAVLKYKVGNIKYSFGAWKVLFGKRDGVKYIECSAVMAGEMSNSPGEAYAVS